MATEPASSSAPGLTQLQPFQAWLERLGLSGKVMIVGALVGVLAVFLPLLSMSVQMPTLSGAHVLGAKGSVNLPGVSTSQSVSVIRDWRGVFCLLGYLATLALAYVLYPPTGLSQKHLGWAGLGVGTFVALLSLWLLIQAVNGTAGALGVMGTFSISVGFGAILNLLAAATVATGGFLKAREEKLV